MADNLMSLHLGENVVRLAKAKNDKGKIEIEALGHQADAPAFFAMDTEKILDDEKKVIKKLVESLRIKQKNVNVVIPDGFTYSQILNMPKLKEKELLSAIRYQADQFIPMPIEETSLDLEILSEDKAKNSLLVLLVAAPQKLIEKVEKVVEQAGLYPESIENELSATARFLSSFYSPTQGQEGASIFVNLGYSSTSFYFFANRLKLLTANHSFNTGLSIFLREAQADTNIDASKAKNLLKSVGFSENASVDLEQILKPSLDGLCGELQKFIASGKEKFHVDSVSHIYLFNLATEIRQLEKKIAEFVSIPSSLFDPLPYAKRTPAVEPFSKDLPAFIPAIGGCLQ